MPEVTLLPHESTIDVLPGSSRRRLACEAALVIGLALTLNLAGNGRVGLWDRDEPRYATCTREMKARGDWIFPTFNDQPRYHKPVLIYWLMRAGYAVGTPFLAPAAMSTTFVLSAAVAPAAATSADGGISPIAMPGAGSVAPGTTTPSRPIGARASAIRRSSVPARTRVTYGL